MSNIATGGPAFPNVPDGAGDKWHVWDTGMTMRDYFAAEAMKQMAWTSENMDACARSCYSVADAMLKAREAA